MYFMSVVNKYIHTYRVIQTTSCSELQEQWRHQQSNKCLDSTSWFTHPYYSFSPQPHHVCFCGRTHGRPVIAKSGRGEFVVGDLVINKARVIWCKGRIRPKNGISLTWSKFIDLMESL